MTLDNGSIKHIDFKIEDPNVDHIKCSDFDHVYEMGEDTFLLMSVLEKHIRDILHNPIHLCVEIGIGTGIVSSHLSNLIRSLSRQRPYFLATDVNSYAADTARSTFIRNGVVGDIVLCDFFSAFHTRLQHRADILLFNPPYVPSEQDELNHRDIRAAWAGGIDGVEVINRFLPQVDRMLSPSGVLFLVLIQANHPQRIRDQMLLSGFSSEIVAEKRVAGEILVIVKFRRSSDIATNTPTARSTQL